MNLKFKETDQKIEIFEVFEKSGLTHHQKYI